jgi:hypothetical protein
MSQTRIIEGALGALLCEALLGRRGGEKQITPNEWREQKMNSLQDKIQASKIALKYLDEGQRDGKPIIGCDVGIVQIKNETSFHTIATYSDTDYKDVLIVYQDSRTPGQEKTYNVHGLHAATAVAESIEEMVTEEAMLAAKEEHDRKQKASESSEGSDNKS